MIIWRAKIVFYVLFYNLCKISLSKLTNYYFFGLLWIRKFLNQNVQLKP